MASCFDFDQLPLIRHDLLDGLKKLEFDAGTSAQAEVLLGNLTIGVRRRQRRQARVIGRAVVPTMEVAVRIGRHRGVTVENH